MKIKEITNPDYETQSVDVVFENGDVECFRVHTDPGNAFYFLHKGKRVYLYDFENGDWLDRMLT